METIPTGIRILVCITFHFNATRLCYLFQIVKSLSDFGIVECDVIVCTNSVDDGEISVLNRLCGKLFQHSSTFQVRSFAELETPRSLPWCHKKILADEFLSSDSIYSHFLYLEDDILFPINNFLYFCKYKNALAKLGVFPGFIRFEYNNSDMDVFLTDQLQRTDISSSKKIVVDGYHFANIASPYAAMYLMDRAMAEEHIHTASADMHRSKAVAAWGRPERATLGLTYEVVPDGFTSRVVCPIDSVRRHPAPMCWVQHLPGNYTNDYRPGVNFDLGKIRMDDGFD